MFKNSRYVARRGDAARSSGPFSLHVDAVIRFWRQIDAESKIALQGNGTHSSIPCKRSIARQVIGIVKNDVRERERERERKTPENESIYLQRNDRQVTLHFFPD